MFQQNGTRGKHWQINTGLRYEYTHTSIGTPTQKDIVNRKYRNLFPSLALKKDLDAKKDLEFSYSRRISRPTYNDIAPFVFFWSPTSFSAGNTTLLPAISDAVKIGYHVKRWIISLQFSHSKNEIGFFQPETDSLSNLIYRSQNLKYLNTLGLVNSLSFNIASWWEVQTNVTAQYLVARTIHLQNNTTIPNYGVNINVINSLKLPKDFAIEVSGMYQSKTLWGISEFLAVGSLNAGVQKKLGKGILRLSIDDIFNTNNWKLKTNLPGNNLNSYFDYDFHTRYARLTYTRSFGNKKLQSVKLQSGAEGKSKSCKLKNKIYFSCGLANTWCFYTGFFVFIPAITSQLIVSTLSVYQPICSAISFHCQLSGALVLLSHRCGQQHKAHRDKRRLLHDSL